MATTLIMIYAARYKNTPCPIHHPRQPGVTTDRGIREHQVPMSVLRYAQRTHEPLVAVDATGDDRFARDPYFADADYCSLLAVPILSRSLLRAVLLLENRLLRGAFTTERLDRLKPRCRPGSARSWTAPSPRPPARWRSCARPRTASTRPSWPKPVEVSAYYLVAEALTNAAKHARASAVTVTAEADTTNAVLRVTIRDDGAGGADFTRGTGLAGLKDRVEALGGRIFVDSPPAAGTTLRAELPLTTAHGCLSSR